MLMPGRWLALHRSTCHKTEPFFKCPLGIIEKCANLSRTVPYALSYHPCMLLSKTLNVPDRFDTGATVFYEFSLSATPFARENISSGIITVEFPTGAANNKGFRLTVRAARILGIGINRAFDVSRIVAF